MGKWTLIEKLVATAALGIIGLVIYCMWKNPPLPGISTTSFGINGITETRCIDGFKFTISEGGFTTQIIGTDGKPISCN